MALHKHYSTPASNTRVSVATHTAKRTRTHSSDKQSDPLPITTGQSNLLLLLCHRQPLHHHQQRWHQLLLLLQQHPSHCLPGLYWVRPLVWVPRQFVIPSMSFVCKCKCIRIKIHGMLLQVFIKQQAFKMDCMRVCYIMNNMYVLCSVVLCWFVVGCVGVAYTCGYGGCMRDLYLIRRMLLLDISYSTAFESHIFMSAYSSSSIHPSINHTFINHRYSNYTIYCTIGISAAYLRQWLYGSCRMGIYSYLLEQASLANELAGKRRDDISLMKKLSMGFVSGGIGSFVGTPAELSLVRMTADSKLPASQQRNYTSVVNCLVRISREEGFFKLWRGATPTVARATLLSACQMGVTSEVKQRLTATGHFGVGGQWLSGYPVLFCSTMASSLCANVVANPFDVIKSRMQNMTIQADGTAAYKNMMDCLVQSVRHEGFLVLWAGFTPAFLKLAPYTVISLTLADKLTRALTGKDAL